MEWLPKYLDGCSESIALVIECLNSNGAIYPGGQAFERPQACKPYMGQFPQDGNFGQNVSVF